jgi:hypothetical protein
LASPPLSTKERALEALLRVINALIELIAHLAVLAALLIGIWLLEKLVHKLWGSQDYLFFDRLKLRYIFDGADLALIVGFIIWGVYSVIAAYVRRPKTK